MDYSIEQSILHNSKTCSEMTRGRTRGDSVRFQDVVSPVKETDSGFGCSEGSPLPHDGKDLTDRVGLNDYRVLYRIEYFMFPPENLNIPGLPKLFLSF